MPPASIPSGRPSFVSAAARSFRPHRSWRRSAPGRRADAPSALRTCSTLPMKPRPLRTWRARWVPCGASATPSSDSGSLYVSVGSRRDRGHEQGRAVAILAVRLLLHRPGSAVADPGRAKSLKRGRQAAAIAASTQPEFVAKRHSSSTVPSIPSIVASASVTSSWRPGSTSALSITSVSTCSSP